MDIQIRAAVSADHSKILGLFTQTFTASDGASEGIVVLPVHDSFITTIENKDWLVQQMLQKWADHVRAGAVTTVEQKW